MSKSPSARPKAKHPKVPAGAKSGLILICDIVDFSLLSREDQRAAVQRLWGYINREDSIQILGSDRIINGTGDGFMIACPDHAQEVNHAEFIEFAEGMVRHMARAKPRLGLRVGIHQGAFTCIDVTFPIDGLGTCQSRQGVGKGINRCARIVPIGDDGDITVTQQFIDEWADTTNESIRQNFSPRQDRDPIEISVKHGETLELRFYRPGTGVNRPWPKKIRNMQDAQRELKNQLSLLHLGFVEYGIALAGPTFKTVDVRVSIFAPGTGKDSRMIVPTNFRFHPKDHGVLKGATRYPIDGEGAGPAGRAFAQRHIAIWAHLPDPAKQSARYLRAFMDSGLDRTTIRNFYRKARAFIAFPFGMDPRHPDGVVCIDVLEPLEQLNRPDLEEIAAFLQSRFAVTLSSLWRLRGQI